MTSNRNGRQTTQGMMALLSSMFPAPAAIPARRRKPVAVKAQRPTRPLAVSLPRSGLQQSLRHRLVSVSLASGMGCLLVAYNLRDTIVAQAAQWAMNLIG